MKMNKWMVYYRNNAGEREGNEYIIADTREEAIRLYRMFFNVDINSITAIPVIETHPSNEAGLS